MDPRLRGDDDICLAHAGHFFIPHNSHPVD